MKKKIAALLMGICALSLLGGCGKDSDSGSNAKSDEKGNSGYNVDDYVTLGEYKGLEITMQDYSISEDSIRQTVENMVKANPVYEKTDKTTVEDGDVANIDYVGMKDGVAFDGGTEENRNLTIGSGSFIEGFEEGLIGAKVGESTELNLTFPDPYQDETLAGQAVVFKVTVNEILAAKEMTYDTLTDEYVTEKFGYATIQEFLDSAKKELEDQSAYYEQSEKQSAILAKLKETCTVSELPEGLLDQRVKDYKEQFEKNCKEQYDMEVTDFLKQNYNMTEEDFNTQTVDFMKDNLNTEFVLEAIAKKEGLEVDEEGFESYLNNMIATYSYESKEALFEQYEEDYLKSSYLCNKALEIVRESAVVTYKSAAGSESEASAEKESTGEETEDPADTNDAANTDEPAQEEASGE